MRLFLFPVLLLLSIASLAQKQQILNSNFEPTEGNDSKYLAITEKRMANGTGYYTSCTRLPLLCKAGTWMKSVPSLTACRYGTMTIKPLKA